MKLRWSRQARQDLKDIGRYIARDNPTAARRTITKLRNRLRQVAQMPQSGRSVPEFQRPDLREVILGNYRMVYLVSADCVIVVTVFEGHRAFPQDALSEP